MGVEATKTPRAIRVTVDLLVDEDIWNDKKAEGTSDAYLVGQVKRTLHVEANAPYYDVEIQDIAREGDGIARIEGFVIFVPEAKVGDKVKIQIDRVMRRFAIGHKI